MICVLATHPPVRRQIKQSFRDVSNFPTFVIRLLILHFVLTDPFITEDTVKDSQPRLGETVATRRTVRACLQISTALSNDGGNITLGTTQSNRVHIPIRRHR